MYCVKCGVELADSEKVCPLCGTRAFHPDMPPQQGQPPYPVDHRPHTEEVSRSGVLFLLTVLALLLCAGWNETAYYPSLADMQSSLTIRNSSSSLFTLRTMAWVPLFVPFVAAYIWYAWRAMNRRPITREEIRGDDHQY